TGVDQRANLLDEIVAHLGVALFIGERAHKSGQIHMKRPHARDPLTKAMRDDLPLMPIDEAWIDGDKPEPSTHAHGRQHARLAQPDDRDLKSAADLQQAGLLEMADDECVVAGPPRLQPPANRLCRTGELVSEWKWRSGG